MAVHLISPSLLNLPANVKSYFHLFLRSSSSSLVRFLTIATPRPGRDGGGTSPPSPASAFRSAEPLGGGATEIVSNDLKRTGMISPVDSGSGDYLATGEASDSGISGRLVNKKTGAEVFNQTFSGKGRLAAHEFADAITQAVTGLPGFASSKLAFIASASGSKELYMADMDGFNTRADHPRRHDQRQPRPEPGRHEAGLHLVQKRLCRRLPDRSHLRQPHAHRLFPRHQFRAAFSPDGSRIALTLSKDGNPEIYTMSLDGGSLTRITRTRGAETSPSWSPTGDRLVYSSDDRGSPQLFISSASSTTDGADWDHLVTGNSYCTKPDWSPDGKLIAFTTRLGGQFQIGVFNVASRTAQLITTVRRPGPGLDAGFAPPGLFQ